MTDAGYDYGEYLGYVKTPFIRDGGQLAFPLSPSAQTLFAASDSFDELSKRDEPLLLSDYNDEPFLTRSSSSFKSNMLSAAIDEFIDCDAAECSFDSDEFVRMLTQLSEIPERRIYSTASNAEELAAFVRGDILLYELMPATLHGYAAMRRAVGEPVSVGWPDNDGARNISAPLGGYYLIPEASENYDAVLWLLDRLTRDAGSLMPYR